MREPTDLKSTITQRFERQRVRLTGHALALVSGDSALADDLVQETFLRVWRRRLHLTQPERLAAYLHRVLRNLALNHLDRAYRRNERAVDCTRLLEPQRDDRSTVDAERVNQALLALPLEQREIVVLRVYHTFSFSEVAEASGAPLGTVHSRYRLALRALERALEVHRER